MSTNPVKSSMKSPHSNFSRFKDFPFFGKRPNGFALIITLVLMVLILLLSVGLLSLSSVQLRTVSQGSAGAQARANAHLALQLAIAELQTQLGPDQRISAPGGQKLAESDTSARKNWVGVYDSWPTSADTRPSPVFRKWLISGDDSVTEAAASVTSTTELAEESVRLVKEDINSDAVEAGLIKVENGAYAWWVADNNMKAKIGGAFKDPVDFVEATERLQASPRASHETFITSELAKTDSKWDRLVSLDTVDIAGTSAQPLFHDATTLANGLVTNVRTGGFRKDLSFLLEKPLSQVKKDALYTAGSTDGINFRELWTAHNIWGELQTSGIPNHPGGANIPNGVPYLRAPVTIADAYNDPFRNYHQITRIQHTLIYSLISRPLTGTSTATPPVALQGYDLLLVIDPVVTIWNPFNVPVTLPRNNAAYNNFLNWTIPYKLTLYKLNGRTYSKNLTGLTDTNFNQTHIGRGEDVVLLPGEVQVLSQSYNTSVQSGNRVDAKLGMNFGSGFVKSFYAKDTTYATASNLFYPVMGTDRLSFSLDPTTSGQTHGFGITVSQQYLGEEANKEFAIGNMSIDNATVANIPSGERDGDRRPGGASQFPEYFRKITRNQQQGKYVNQIEVPVGADGASRKWPLFAFTLGFRTETDPDGIDMTTAPAAGGENKRNTGRALMSLNPKILTYDLGDLTDPSTARETPLQIGLRPLTSLNSAISTMNGQNGFFGASNRTGTSYLITHSVPTSPIFSLGALQHSLANGLPDNSKVASDGSTFMNVKYLRPSISHAISNSFAPSIMSPSQTSVTRGTGKWTRDLADHSFLANRALWDDYFYSSISPETKTAHRDSSTAYGEQKTRLANFIGMPDTVFEKLPNTRFLPWVQDPQDVMDSIFNGTAPSADADQRIGAHLLIDGAFNVNSTSVNAWKSFLSGLKGASVPVSPFLSPVATPGYAATTETPVANLLTAGGEQIEDNELSDPNETAQWTGFRALTDDQIDELANAIVKQVRLRGPFTSLSDFVNRRPGNDEELALSGPLQSALDDQSVSINEAFRSGERTLSVSEATAKGFEFPEAEAIAKSAGSTGYVKQGDLLTSIGPMIAVRGDTFTIRTCGEARDSAGKVLARAYCEAIVQRTPDYVDSKDEAHISTPTSQANIKFGRKFEVVSFRYLQEDEI